MARVLLVDPSETAWFAMRGILSRGDHKCACVSTAQDGWDFIRGNAKVDLLITELQLTGGQGGQALVEQLKKDRLLKHLPIVIYTAKVDRAAVRRGLDMHVQNFLVKPFHDDDVFAEIEKCEANPWWNQLFEEEHSFCRMMGYSAEQLHQMLADLRGAVDSALVVFRSLALEKDAAAILARAGALLEQAEAAGAWAVVEGLGGVVEAVESALWPRLPDDLEVLEFAGQLVMYRLDDSLCPKGFLDHAGKYSPEELREQERWRGAIEAGACPVVAWPRLQSQIDAMPGCPVIDSSAAAFRQVANGHPSCINPLMDIVDRDPGLAAQLLIAANKMHPAGENDNVIEDPRLAVGLLGEKKLESQASQLVLAQARFLELPPGLSWSQFWMFQTGVARIAQYTCHYLEFYSMESQARMAGLLHDIGKLVLLHLYPIGFRVMLEHAQKHHVTLAETEKLFLGCTTKEMGVRLAERCKLSRHYINVLRWIDNPEEASEDANLVAIVSLARDLCRYNRVGASGDPPLDHPTPLEETVEWSVLKQQLYPSFDLRKFELQVHAYCQDMNQEFIGRHGANPVATAIE
jgi:HD-like signal output (HDOD) protein/CheY-like chemotaxis protein